jgi:Ca2+/Na+ antiporter
MEYNEIGMIIGCVIGGIIAILLIILLILLIIHYTKKINNISPKINDQNIS